ncbi:hypothetical protein DL93DRAFT_2086333 [Clavulina sp. PMI_390]|nr:hypothetical protein DL93DRAFT_2086333 [Clavulina sp. PMI_390]
MSRVVFVGNVPYEMTEEQLIEVFSAVGPVAGFRLVFDRESGKPKGFGFCEYYDHESAKSAVRNLNGHDVKGRPLRIDLADSDPLLEGKTTHRGELDDSKPVNTLPPGVPVPPGSSALDAITHVLATMQPSQLMDVMGHMKSFVLSNPEQARQLLQTQPQLSYALFQAMVMNNIVDPSVLQRMLAATASQGPSRQAAPPPAPAQPVAPPIPPPSIPPNMAHHPPPPFPYSMPPAAAQFGRTPNMPSPAPTPPHFGSGMYGQPVPQAPPPPQAPAAPPADGGITDEQRNVMLMQVLSLTQAQIDGLPPAERATIQQLRAQLGVQ